MIRFIDIGANMTDPIFSGLYRGKQAHADDLALVLKRERDAGVQKIFITGTHLEDSKEAIEAIVSKPDAKGFLYSDVSCHPTRCSELEEHKDGPQTYYDELLKVAASSKTVVAIGECGLDYDPEKAQLPMFLLNRNTGDEFYNLVKQNRHKFKNIVAHSFTGTVEEMKKLIELDLYIGVNGYSALTFVNAN